MMQLTFIRSISYNISMSCNPFSPSSKSSNKAKVSAIKVQSSVSKSNKISKALSPDFKRLSIRREPLLSVLNDHLLDYPTPSNLNYFWNFGSLAGICLVLQIATGIFLAMFYSCHVDLAFTSVEHIMRDVNNGWLLRYMHANGASMFFVVVYFHIFRGLYYGSYVSPRELVWCSGVLILLLMIITAFIGYVLPWGQMSLWGATVITSLASAIPVVGDSIVLWLWGGFSVDNATLNRFFSLHYLFPFLIAGATIIHLAALHQYGSNNPMGSESVDKISFYPYFYVKDMVGLVVFVIMFSVFVFYYPNVLGHPDNYIPANAMSTPSHIVPEWYFLWPYAILRSIPNKLGGVLALGLVFVCLFSLPFLHSSGSRSSTFRPIYKKFFFLLVCDLCLLVWIGGQGVEDPYILIGQLSSVYFFIFFLIIIPVLGRLESAMIFHAGPSISCGSVFCGSVFCGSVFCGSVFCGSVFCGSVFCGSVFPKDEGGKGLKAK